MINKMRAIGVDGLAMLVFSNVIILGGLGGTLLGLVFYISWVACCAPVSAKVRRWIVVPGMSLRDNAPNDEFRCRLERAARLFERSAAGGKIIILGGMTGYSSVSEAAAGKEYLISSGVPESGIVLEQESNNTLENLRFAKAAVNLSKESKVVLVTNRYHLARCGAMAKSLQIGYELCAAEERFDWGVRNCFRLVKEAYHLHWYFSGRYWAIVTGNKKMLRRLQ